MVHFRFSDVVDIHEVSSSFPVHVCCADVASLMPYLDDATDMVLASVPLEDILRSPSPAHEE